MRIKKGFARHKKHKRLKKATKGFLRSRRSSIKRAHEAVIKAGTRAYQGRKKRKRDLRALWIIRLNAAARKEGMTYSTLISALKKKNIELDRKILAELAVNHPDAFKKIVEEVKK